MKDSADRPEAADGEPPISRRTMFGLLGGAAVTGLTAYHLVEEGEKQKNSMQDNPVKGLPTQLKDAFQQAAADHVDILKNFETLNEACKKQPGMEDVPLAYREHIHREIPAELNKPYLSRDFANSKEEKRLITIEPEKWDEQKRLLQQAKIAALTGEGKTPYGYTITWSDAREIVKGEPAAAKQQTAGSVTVKGLQSSSTERAHD